jgi:light-regulated signal transduction histidine kinase (bacteriophytochrome)
MDGGLARMEQLSPSGTALLVVDAEEERVLDGVPPPVLTLSADRDRSTEELERRTEELGRSDAQLDTRTEELRCSTEELEELAHAVSHDLSQPLTAISGFADLLARRYGEQLHGEGDEFLTFIVNASSRMRGMIQDLTTYIRLGVQPSAVADVDPSRLIEAVLDSLGSDIAEADAVVTVDPLPMVRGESREIGQLLMNLISNALKFRGDERPEIHVSGHRERGVVRFSVSDNGIGIDTPFPERVFELFQRLHGASVYPGNGTGLAICKKIVERHGGQIWIEGSDESGTTVEFTLPAADSGA